MGKNAKNEVGTIRPKEQVLPAGVLLGDYEILSPLYRSANCIAYLAINAQEQQTVVLREFFPVPHVEREPGGCRVVPVAAEKSALVERRRSDFLHKAHCLSKVNHPGVLPVQRAFAALGTVYTVQPYDHSPTLLQAAPAPEMVTEAWLKARLLKLLDALTALHGAGVLHKSLSLDNILMRQDGSPVIIGPDDSRETPPEHAADALPTLCYRPLELLQAKLPVGPWSDMYSLGGICYRLITGELPPNCIYRSYDGVPYRPLTECPELYGRYSREFLSTIDRAMEIWPQDRWQNIAEWVQALNGEKVRHGSRWWGCMGAVLLLSLLLLLLLYALVQCGAGDGASAALCPGDIAPPVACQSFM